MCRLRNITMLDYQESVTTGQTDRRMLRRWHKNGTILYEYCLKKFWRRTPRPPTPFKQNSIHINTGKKINIKTFQQLNTLYYVLVVCKIYEKHRKPCPVPSTPPPPSIFRAQEPKAPVTYCDHALSGVCRPVHLNIYMINVPSYIVLKYSWLWSKTTQAVRT